MSSTLLWQIVRDRSSFLMKQKGVPGAFTREPCNLTGKNSFKYSGLCHAKAIGVEPVKDKKGSGRGVVLVTRRRKATHKPAKSFTRVELKRDSRRTMKAIKNLAEKSGYRRDLKLVALRRASALVKSQKVDVKKSKAKSAKK